MEKGTYGYLDNYKKNKLMMTAVLLSLIAAAVIVILVVFQTKDTYLIVIPIILALPCAKQMVAYIVVYPFRSMKREEYESLKEFLKGKNQVYPVYDVTLASEQGFSYLEFVLIFDGDLYGCMGKGNRRFQTEDIQAYLSKIMAGQGYKNKVFVYENAGKALLALDKRLSSVGGEQEVNNKRSKAVKEALLVFGV